MEIELALLSNLILDKFEGLKLDSKDNFIKQLKGFLLMFLLGLKFNWLFVFLKAIYFQASRNRTYIFEVKTQCPNL